MAESNNIVHEKYITVATDRKNIEEAKTFFTRVGNDLTADFAKISSTVTECSCKDRLRISMISLRRVKMKNFILRSKRRWQEVQISRLYLPG